MKHIIAALIVLFLIEVLNNAIRAQQVSTLYFMENSPERNYLNPAFQPLTQFYLSLPIIGFTQLDVGNNSLALKDFIYRRNDQNITFLNKNGDVGSFYRNIRHNMVIRTDLQTNLLTFGLRHEQTYWNFSLSEKVNGMAAIPKDAFKLALYGTPDINANNYNFATLQTDMTAYTELAAGFSRQEDEQLTIGAKLKLLLGNVNISNTNKAARLYAGIDKWVLNLNGSVNVSAPVAYRVDSGYQSVSVSSNNRVGDWLKPAGVGAGVDVGAVYRLNDKLTLSGAITDLGFIRWTKNTQNFNYTSDLTYDGITQQTANGTNFQNIIDKITTGNYVSDSLNNVLQTAIVSRRSNNHYFTGTTAKINLGAEYALFDNALSLGLLSFSSIFKRTITEELTASINYRPAHWINASLSYSAFNGCFGSLGAGLGLKTGFIHWLVAADYIPAERATFSPSYISPNYPTFKILAPYNIPRFNLAIGMSIVIDKTDGERNSSSGFGSYKKNKGPRSHHKKSNCNCDTD
ncbi:hypothetical protein Palpr_0841 [Paludibacter propionicigenes WB4]|uniref:DUF5723 domain-containing protein n=1 Tax=Paludibacter propionicigenes (strain DSM 17365 / JCM 13257 / WB4) TaxID=694427 RepID=E4T2P9_PALPW|nr:DUF5723 family protein [Paludibacter propionicigenes]ADQ78993.1 hypothetical protein Palpr_0841 [Paludibacter propionicigenes WB4]